MNGFLDALNGPCLGRRELGLSRRRQTRRRELFRFVLKIEIPGRLLYVDAIELRLTALRQLARARRHPPRYLFPPLHRSGRPGEHVLIGGAIEGQLHVGLLGVGDDTGETPPYASIRPA